MIISTFSVDSIYTNSACVKKIFLPSLGCSVAFAANGISLFKLKSKSKLKDYTPKTIEELQFYQTIGYKNSIEVLLEKHIDIINNGNNLKFEINPLINKSLITAGVCCTHVYFGQDNKICEEPISIRDLKVIGGTKRNYSDANAFIIDQ